ncbi:MAG: hypothetical protein E7576_07025 [Ruminococcaceae bacterium]|nr:hypothetical protein [Oscillospiraceae bacterium]
MGNRAVIMTPAGYGQESGIGIYLHWNGGYDSISAFLKYCELRGFRPPDEDCYGWARLCQIIGNYFGGDLSIGIDAFPRLPVDNGDNGTFIIEKWKIVGRKFNDLPEQHIYDLCEMVCAIDKAQPRKDRLGKKYIKIALKGESI